MADPTTLLISLAVGAAIRLALKRDKEEGPFTHPKPATLTEPGAQLPVVIGRDRLAPIFAGEFNRRRVIETSSTAGGKGLGGGSSTGIDNEVFFSDGIHLLCSGVGRRLLSIKENGTVIWPLEGQFPNGISPETHPSGSTLIAGNLEEEPGSFRIYWGETDQPINTNVIATALFPLETNLPHVMWVQWVDKRLGGVGAWQDLEYDVEVGPYKSLVGFGSDYLSAPSDLPGSEPWLRNSLGFDEDTDCFPALTYTNGTPSTVKVAGDRTAKFSQDDFFFIKDSLFVDGTYRVETSSFDPLEVINQPTSDFTTVLGPQDVSDLTVINGAGSTTNLPNETIPGVLLDPLLFTFAFELEDTSPLGGTYRVEFSPRGGAFQNITDGFYSISVYIRNQSGVNNLARVRAYSEPTGFQVQVVAQSTASGSFSFFQDGVMNGSFTSFFVGNGWHRLEILLRCNANDNPRVELWAGGDDITGFTGLPMKFAIGSGDFPNAMRQVFGFSEQTTVTGVTTISFDDPLPVFEDFDGTVCALSPDPNGAAGANAAHVLYQLLFEGKPHGRGLSTDLFDLDSLEQLGIDCEADGLRTHIKIDRGVSLSQRLAEFLLDTGIDIYWDFLKNKHGFKLIRPESAFARVPGNMAQGAMPRRARKLEGGDVSTMVFSAQIAEDNYRNASIAANNQGIVSEFGSAGDEREIIHSARDAETAQRIAKRRALLEFAKPSLFSLELGRDAMAIRSGDVIDVRGVTGIDSSDSRVLSLRGVPKDGSIQLEAYNEFWADLNASAQPEIPRFSAGFPSPEDDFAVRIIEDPVETVSEGALEGILVLRIASQEDNIRAGVVASEDGASFWPIGVARAIGGGTVVSPNELVFRAPTGEFTERIPQFPTGTNMLRGALTSGAIFEFDSLEDLGDNLWRIVGASVIAAAEDTVFVWAKQSLPVLSFRLPKASPSTEFKVVPTNERRLGSIPSAPGLQPVP